MWAAGLVNKALEISRKRSEALSCLRAAFERGDDAEALKIAKGLCGIDNEQKSDPTYPGVDRRAGRRRPGRNPGPAGDKRTNRKNLRFGSGQDDRDS